MRQCRVAALALPLPAAHRQTVFAVWALDLKRDWRNEWTRITAAFGAASAGKGRLEELAYLAVCIGEVAGGGVAMVRRNDQPTAGCETFNERPEIVAGELIGGVTNQGIEPLTSDSAIMNLAVWPMVPENPVLYAVD